MLSSCTDTNRTVSLDKAVSRCRKMETSPLAAVIPVSVPARQACFCTGHHVPLGLLRASLHGAPGMLCVPLVMWRRAVRLQLAGQWDVQVEATRQSRNQPRQSRRGQWLQEDERQRSRLEFRRLAAPSSSVCSCCGSMHSICSVRCLRSELDHAWHAS